MKKKERREKFKKRGGAHGKRQIHRITCTERITKFRCALFFFFSKEIGPTWETQFFKFLNFFLSARSGIVFFSFQEKKVSGSIPGGGIIFYTIFLAKFFMSFGFKLCFCFFGDARKTEKTPFGLLDFS